MAEYRDKVMMQSLCRGRAERKPRVPSNACLTFASNAPYSLGPCGGAGAAALGRIDCGPTAGQWARQVTSLESSVSSRSLQYPVAQALFVRRLRFFCFTELHDFVLQSR